MTDGTRTIDLETIQAAFILFSTWTWLPIAPHITSLVSGLFALKSFSCPLKNTENDDVHGWLLAEAAHNVCRFYSRQRQEPDTLIFMLGLESYFWVDR